MRKNNERKYKSADLKKRKAALGKKPRRAALDKDRKGASLKKRSAALGKKDMGGSESLAERFLSLIERSDQRDDMEPLDAKMVQKAFTQRIQRLGIEGVHVSQVEIDSQNGDIMVAFSDDNSNYMAVLFTVDPKEGAQAIVLDDVTQGNEVDVISLDALSPVMLGSEFTAGMVGSRIQSKMLNLVDLRWMNKSTMLSILRAGELTGSNKIDQENTNREVDAFGNTLSAPAESLVANGFTEKEIPELNEAGQVVVSGGRGVKLPTIQKKAMADMTTKQMQSVQTNLTKLRQFLDKQLSKSLNVRKRTLRDVPAQ